MFASDAGLGEGASDLADVQCYFQALLTTHSHHGSILHRLNVWMSVADSHQADVIMHIIHPSIAIASILKQGFIPVRNLRAEHQRIAQELANPGLQGK